MESPITPSFAHHPGEIILGVAAHLSVSDLNALIQTAHRFHELLSQTLYDRAPVLIRNDGDTPLIWAARQGQVACVQKLVERDPDPARLIDGRAAIHDAAAAGQDQIVAVLLEAGVSVSLSDRDGRTPLELAAAHDQGQVLRRLLASGAGDVAAPSEEDWEWGCAFEAAVSHGHESVARILLQVGASIARDHPAFPMIHEAINAKLRLALYLGRCEMVTLLLEFGADAHLLRRGNLLPLHIAASHGHMEAVLLLLQHGADIAAVDEQGDAAIHHAAAGGSVEVVKFLLDQGVPVDIRGDAETTVLLNAVIYRQAAVIQLLLEAGADVTLTEASGHNALALAAYCGTIEIVELLLAHGAAVDVLGPDDRTVLHAAVEGANPDVVPSLCRAGAAINALNASGNTALHLAALHGRTAFARLLLEMGADLSVLPADGRTALHYAAIAGQTELLQLLVDAGARVDALHRNGGHTALHYAAVHGNADAFRVLLNAAEVQKVDLLSPCWCGGTVLSKAATEGHRGIIELIVERGVDVTRCYDGSSALHAAAAAGQTDLVEFLLSIGADPLQLDWFGRSSVDWAARHLPTLEKLRGYAPPSAPLLDEEKRTSALKKGITTLATRALTEGKSVSYRLGKCLQYINDVAAARMAFLYDARADPSFPDGAWAVCDLCGEKPAVSEGRFVCQTCPDIDLCGPCVDRYYQERLQIRLCDGHEFLEVQASNEELLAIQPKECRESWLHGLIVMYNSST
ncbi:ankyrin repeat-containing protein [Aspergillus terreus]|uniref:Ankyrin repeat-containing protein n=1 Tax=Aspergillus terreus TaxID=33178 RepID=A0A5M3Z2G3_ASPTE|nr:hypothetical protein ATETN484_0006019100 [Aspergillus terreus]GFF19932.1 ankyrin repeat-containing protein [Aspergillus terreus]